MSTGLDVAGRALRSLVSVIEPPRSLFRGPVVSTDLPPQQSSTAHVSLGNGERGTGKGAGIEMAPPSLPASCHRSISSPTPMDLGVDSFKETLCQPGKGLQMRAGDGEKGWVSRIPHPPRHLSRKPRPHPREDPRFQPGMGSLTAQIVNKYCRRPEFCRFCSRAPFSTPPSPSSFHGRGTTSRRKCRFALHLRASQSRLHLNLLKISF